MCTYLFSDWNDFHFKVPPCIRLARGKFELTNQDSAGGKNSSVLTSSRNQATFVTGDGINVHGKGFTISKTKLVGNK